MLEEEQMNESEIASRPFHASSLEELCRKLDEAKIAIQDYDVYTHEEVMTRLKDRLSEI